MTKYYVAYDNTTGAVLTRYDGDIQAPTTGIPVIEVKDQASMLQTCEPGWMVVNGVLVAPPAPTAAQLLAQAQAAQISIITQACAAAITSGFTSSALGRAHTYPSSPTDQTNLVTHVMSSLLPGLPSTWATPYPCCDANGVWGSKEHTASQIQQVGADWKAFLSSCLLKKRALEDKIKLAKTVGKVQALAW